MSVACLSIFLLINGKSLRADPAELAEKAIWLATTSHDHDFEMIKSDLERWVKDRMVDDQETP